MDPETDVYKLLQEKDAEISKLRKENGQISTDLSDKQILRVPVNRIEAGMIFAQDYQSSYGLLIASRGEAVTDDMIKPLIRFAENEEVPHKLLMLA